MQIFYVLYFTLITCLLSTTMPESHGRWFVLYKGMVSLISYTRPTPTLLPYHFVIVTNSVSVENSLSSTGGVDVCWLSPFGIDGTCNPLDVPITPTPTTVLQIPGTRTTSANAALPITLSLIPYEDMFAVQVEATRAFGKPRKFKSTQGRIPNDTQLAYLLDLLTTTTSTMVVVQLLTVRNSITDFFLC